jgi:hypothetical protein
MAHVSGYQPEENELTASARSPTKLMVAARDDKYRGWQLAAGATAVVVFLAFPVAFTGDSSYVGGGGVFGTLAQRSWEVVGFCATVGLASAAILQVGRQVLGLRSFWQSRWVASWVKDRYAELWRSWLGAYPTLRSGRDAEPGSIPQEAAVEQRIGIGSAQCFGL